MKRVLIIGSKGFIGRSCVRHFERNWKVTQCDISPSADDNEYFQISSKADFARVISSSNFDVCINASGSANVGFSFQNPALDYELNVNNVRYILEALNEFNLNCKLINFSSAAVYGNPDKLPIAEDAKTQPLSPYGINKLESENVLKDYSNRKGLKTCSLRVFSAYGPGLQKQLFWDIYQKCKKGEKVQLFGTGTESRDFVFINDILQAIDCVIKNAQFKGEVYNVGTGMETSIKEAAEIFLSFLPESHRLEFSGKEKNGDPMNWKADISKLSKLDFIPLISLKEGLKATVQNYLSI